MARLSRTGLSKTGRWLPATLGSRPWDMASRRRSRVAARLLGDAGLPPDPLRRRAAMCATGGDISEADLHAYIDGGLGRAERIEVEAFLAAHPEIANRVDAYRSHLIAVNAAFRAGEPELPPQLADLAWRYARAVSSSAPLLATLGTVGMFAILCAMAGAALGAYG